jgi:cytochrome c-type biogenesis protein CcmH
MEPLKFESSSQESRYKALIAELRCLVCQNQNLADSNAELARDLRLLTYNMILSGSSDKDIVQFMVSRYGDFVLYRPPFKPSTALLWLAPLLFMAGGFFVLFRIFRWRKNIRPLDVPPDQRAKVRKLLQDDNSA